MHEDNANKARQHSIPFVAVKHLWLPCISTMPPLSMLNVLVSVYGDWNTTSRQTCPPLKSDM